MSLRQFGTATFKGTGTVSISSSTCGHPGVVSANRMATGKIPFLFTLIQPVTGKIYVIFISELSKYYTVILTNQT